MNRSIWLVEYIVQEDRNIVLGHSQVSLSLPVVAEGDQPGQQ